MIVHDFYVIRRIIPAEADAPSILDANIEIIDCADAIRI
jgi:hypothetical protein